MMVRWIQTIALCFVAASTAAEPLPGQKKDMLVDLQRDVAILQEAIRQSEQNTAQRIAALEALLKQNMETTGRLQSGLEIVERAMNKQSDALTPPLTRTTAKVDAMAEQFGGLRDAVEESNAMLLRLMQEIADIKTQLTTIPPPGFGSAPGESGDQAPVLDESFFASAMSDFNRGNYDFAREQFVDFLQLSPNSPRAADAQYFLGAIAYNQSNYDEAIRQFDMVLERYPVGVLTADALYKKALSLYRLDRRDDALRAFQSVVDRFPHSSVAPNAKAMVEQVQSAGVDKPSPFGR